MSTTTELVRLTDINDMLGKRELMDEIKQWKEEEAEVKGRDLWGNAVRSWCEGGSAFRDEATIMGDFQGERRQQVRLNTV